MLSTADAFAVAQGLLGVRVFGRMVATRGGIPVEPQTHAAPGSGTVAAIVPVLNERARLGACLEGLTAAPATLVQILVVDGGSSDGTQALAREFAARDARVTLVAADPVPVGWNGKAWNLACGLAASDPAARWILTIDADVTPHAHLVPSLVAHAAARVLDAFSAAPLLRLSGLAEAAVHPAFLATLVYRFGLPGNVARRPRDVQANGQCFLARRALLLHSQGFEAARASRSDDVTIARRLVRDGAEVGFYEGSALSSVSMYGSARECWANWPRSLPLRDRSTSNARIVLGLAEVLLVQALPLYCVLASLAARRATDSPFFRLNAALTLARLGVLAGTRRAYADAPWTYWLAMFADLPAGLELVRATFARRHVWRGRELVAERCSA